ncbi:PLP-dependent aminotransferase family protein [Caulobacter sp. KR2-114]|uniref:aminotransferase-like domain-containing protein n=1 Tax=Caulobacter sp. KR2-114 TaxID=3400912 RepID=UPI003C1015AF
MTTDDVAARWLDRLQRDGRPLYLALAEALEAAIREGELQPGDQLPPQRAVAERLGVDLTTITRAYGAARARGLLEGTVGRGTFVRARADEDDGGLVDLSMNLPPPPDGISLGALLKDGARAVLDRADAATLMSYHPGAGTLGQKLAAAAWLAPVLGDVAPDRVLIAPGAQSALSAILAAFLQRGEALVVEPLTYPGIKAAAALHGVRLLSCPVDGEGFVPEALEQTLALGGAAAVYLIPTTQNPTGTTMGADRRRTIAAIVAAANAWLIEDDPYSRLFDTPAPALASVAPERSFHIATLSKVLSPGLRTAFVVPPPGEPAARLAEALRATTLMPSPLVTTLVSGWIRDGTAEALLQGVRREARARRALAAKWLPQARGAAEAIHVWLDLPEHGSPAEIRLMGQARGLSLVSADAFAVEGAKVPAGARISLGGPARRAGLTEALKALAELARAPATGGGLVV